MKQPRGYGLLVAVILAVFLLMSAVIVTGRLYPMADQDEAKPPRCRIKDMNPRLAIAWCACGETLLIPDAIAIDMGFHRKQDQLLDIYLAHRRIRKAILKRER